MNNNWIRGCLRNPMDHGLQDRSLYLTESDLLRIVPSPNSFLQCRSGRPVFAQANQRHFRETIRLEHALPLRIRLVVRSLKATERVKELLGLFHRTCLVGLSMDDQKRRMDAVGLKVRGVIDVPAGSSPERLPIRP